ncbi:MAG: alpha/beta hydrolase [Alphaproteobacteria bacterium]|nr:alpha/beta hydrolase [Alphaproteobacteria bacterium]
MNLCRNLQICAALAAIGLTIFGFPSGASAQFRLDPAFPNEHQLGAKAAHGAIVWSHGRSVTSEDSLSPTPPYMESLQHAGWDTFRFNRMRDGDTLSDSARELVNRVAQLKRQGYQRIVLAGQSFGAFLSLMAADASDDVHAVIATAPAAYGSFSDYYESWENNATQLYPLLERVRRARIMLFYFHGDDFDPGGRGAQSEAILAAHNIDHLIVDQPPQLTTHWAATTGLFVRRFADCIRNFIEASTSDAISCSSSWGTSPSQQIAFPAHFHNVSTAETPPRAEAFAGKWYGYYANGREVMFAIESSHGDTVTAIYSLGAGIRPGEKAEWVRRTGRIEGNEILFKEKGLNTLRYKLRPDGRMQAWWHSLDGKSTLETMLRRTDTAEPAPTVTAAGAP